MLTIEDEEELKRFTLNENLLKQYRKKLMDLSCDDEYKENVMNDTIEENAMYEQTYGAGYRNGIEQGIEKGTINTKKEIVLKLNNKKIPLDVISEYTDLSIDEIKNFINEIPKRN